MEPRFVRAKMQSIRSLPRGQFDKYRQMFDTLADKLKSSEASRRRATAAPTLRFLEEDETGELNETDDERENDSLIGDTMSEDAAAVAASIRHSLTACVENIVSSRRSSTQSFQQHREPEHSLLTELGEDDDFGEADEVLNEMDRVLAGHDNDMLAAVPVLSSSDTSPAPFILHPVHHDTNSTCSNSSSSCGSNGSSTAVTGRRMSISPPRRPLNAITEDTNSLLSTLCTDHRQIADFLIKYSAVFTADKEASLLEQRDGEHQRRRSLESDHMSQCTQKTPEKANGNNASFSSNSVSPSLSTSTSASLVPKQNEENGILTVTPLSNINIEVNQKDDNEIRPLSVPMALVDHEKRTYALSNVTHDAYASTACTYFELEDIDVSDMSFMLDDSSDDDDDDDGVYDGTVDDYDIKSCISINDPTLFATSSKAATLPTSPPPPLKPKRTFEHDMYVEMKVQQQQQHEQRSASSLTANDRKQHDANTDDEHIYETVASVNDYLTRSSIKKWDQVGKTVHTNANTLSPHESPRLFDPNDRRQSEQLVSNSKFALSEPNLTQIGKPRKSKHNENFLLAPFGKLLNNIKKTLSRKSLTGDSQEDVVAVSQSSFRLHIPGATVTESSDYTESNSLHRPRRQQAAKLIRQSPIDLNNNKNNSKHKQRWSSVEGGDVMSICEKSIAVKTALGSSGVQARVTKIATPVLTRGSHLYANVLDDAAEQMNTLFDCALVVRLDEPKSHSTDELNTPNFSLTAYDPQIQWKFPKDFPVDPYIANFCFPDPNFRNELKKYESEIFKFTLTNEFAVRNYGFCLRMSSKSYQLVICLISRVDALEMYHTVLQEAEQMLLHNGLDASKSLLVTMYANRIPKRGESLTIKNLASFTTGKGELVLNRSYDRRLKHINMSIILLYPFELTVKIFVSMLKEKKIVFISKKLSVLSSTIQAFELLLYPFSWPYAFVPVLPVSLIDTCEAPTPYIFGLLRSDCCKIALTRYKKFSGMLIVDLDKQRCLQEDGDELSLLPDSITKSLKSDLNGLVHASRMRQEYEKNIELCRIFSKVFVKSIGHYKKFLVPFDTPRNGYKYNFSTKEFIDQAPSKEIRRFLEWFTETQLFELFISKKKTAGLVFAVMFDEAIREQAIQMALRQPITPNVVNIPVSSPRLRIKDLKKKNMQSKNNFKARF